MRGRKILQVDYMNPISTHFSYICLCGVIANRYGSESTYFNEAAEDYLQLFMDRKENDGSWLQNQGHWYLSTPTPQSSRWEGYLGDPVWLPRYLDSLNITELEIYEKIRKTVPVLDPEKWNSMVRQITECNLPNEKGLRRIEL